VLQEVAAVDRVVEVLPFAVARLPRQVVAGVDAALSADAVRTFDRPQAHQVHVDAHFGQSHGGGQSGQSPTYDHDAFFCHVA